METEPSSKLPEKQPPPRFFKVIMSTVNNPIMIPPAFVMENGAALREKTVFLKVTTEPSASKWPVELAKRGPDEVWFERGWKEFADSHSVSFCYFLVFAYECNSEFHVSIFDHSFTEMDEKTLHRTLRKMMRPPRIFEQDVSIALEQAKAFKSANEFCIVPINRSFIKYGHFVKLPRDFVKKCFDDGAKVVTLQVCSFYKMDQVSSSSVQYFAWSKEAIILSGWTELAQECDIKAGDACVFEQVKGCGNVLKVIVYRGDRRN